MTNATRTPGPWDVSFGRNDAAIHAGGTIAMIDDVMTGWRANAALIAAAPDLLEALQEAVNKGYMWDNDPKLWSKARAAIAKATGV